MAFYLGFDVCRSAFRNPKFTQGLADVIKEAGVTEGCPKAKGNLIYLTASKVPLHSSCLRKICSCVEC